MTKSTYEINNKTATYELKDDGSWLVTCSVCGKDDYLPADHKLSMAYAQNNDLAKGFRCRGCWEKDRSSEKQQRLEDIYLGQAINLAHDEAIINADYLSEDFEKIVLDRIPEKLDLIKKAREKYGNGKNN